MYFDVAYLISNEMLNRSVLRNSVTRLRTVQLKKKRIGLSNLDNDEFE